MTALFLRMAAALVAVGVLAAIMASDLTPLLLCLAVIWAIYQVAQGFNKSGRS